MSKVDELKNVINNIKNIIKDLENKEINDLKARENYFWDNHGELMNRYPFLVSQLCSSNDDSMLDYMLNQIEQMEKGNKTNKETDVQVGQKIVDTYVKPVIDNLKTTEKK